MWPDRRLVELFEIEHPIVLAPTPSMSAFGGKADIRRTLRNVR